MLQNSSMKKIMCLFFFLGSFQFATSQNLIPNPSFEEVNEIVPYWSGTFSKFNRRIKTWSSPTQGSPDILFYKLLDKMFPKREKVDLGKHLPRTGKLMVGIKTFGCLTNTMHCKEYLQVPFKEPLRSGEEYYYEYWVSPVELSVKVNGFGMALGLEKMEDFMHTGMLDIPPAHIAEEIIDGDSIQWHKISGTFIADDNHKYAILGNFNDDQMIKSKVEKDGMDYGYYLIDDVLVKPTNPKIHSLSPPVAVSKFKPNKVMILPNLLFDLDQATIKESSFPTLNDLADYLIAHPINTIKITGHTDNQGNQDHNLRLSQERAMAIKTYLIQKNIDSERIQTFGLGSQHPLVDNHTEENRKLNRRVEIKINDI